LKTPRLNGQTDSIISDSSGICKHLWTRNYGLLEDPGSLELCRFEQNKGRCTFQPVWKFWVCVWKLISPSFVNWSRWTLGIPDTMGI